MAPTLKFPPLLRGAARVLDEAAGWLRHWKTANQQDVARHRSDAEAAGQASLILLRRR